LENIADLETLESLSVQQQIGLVGNMCIGGTITCFLQVKPAICWLYKLPGLSILKLLTLITAEIATVARKQHLIW